MHPIKESFQFYARNVESLLLISVLIVFPFLLVHNVVMNYVNLITTLTGATIVSSFFNLFLLLVFIGVIQLPFAQFVQYEMEGEERPLLKAFRAFAEHSFSVFVFSVLYVIAVSLGMMLLLIPGVILLIFFYLTPYLVAVKERSAWACWRAAFEMGKKHFFQIFGLFLISSLIQWTVSVIGLYSVSIITTSYGAIFFTQLLLNVLVFPFIAVMFTMYVQKWTQEASTIEQLEAEPV